MNCGLEFFLGLLETHNLILCSLMLCGFARLGNFPTLWSGMLFDSIHIASPCVILLWLTCAKAEPAEIFKKMRSIIKLRKREFQTLFFFKHYLKVFINRNNNYLIRTLSKNNTVSWWCVVSKHTAFLTCQSLNPGLSSNSAQCQESLGTRVPNQSQPWPSTTSHQKPKTQP